MKRITLLFLMAAMILPLTMNAQTKNDVPEGYASVTLTAGDVWGDGTGYQMLLDANSTAYGTIIPETGGLTSNGDASAQVYAEFEYKIPENADGSCTTSNIVFNNSITILIPAGVYDWCITNPTPGDRIWIASVNGNVGGRADNYEFLSGVGYEFTVTLGGNNDQVDVTIDDPTVPVIPTDVVVTPTVTTGEVVWVAGENNATWNLRWRPWVDPVSVGMLWDLPLDGYAEQTEGWVVIDADGDGNNWGLAYSSDAQDDVCFYSESYSNGGALDPDNWLITPEVGLGGTLKFKTWNYSPSYLDKIMVYVCDNPNYASVDEFVAISSFIEPSDSPEEIVLDLSTYEGTGYIAFRHYDCYDKWQIYIDDIEVIPANPAELQEWTVVEGLTDPAYTIEGLTPETKYEVQVMAFNEFDVNTDWTETVVFTTLEGYVKHILGYGSTNNPGGYYLIASPIGEVNPGNVANMVSNSYDLYRFNQEADLEWENYKSHHFSLEPGVGYLYANSQDVDLVFSSTAYTGSGEITLHRTSDTVDFQGWNLVGNPFAADIAYIEGDRDFYTMNAAGTDLELSTSNSVEHMEGIFVEAAYDGETITFTTTQPSVVGKGIILNLSQGRGVSIDRAIVRFGEGRTLSKFMLDESNTKMYIPQEGKDFAVVRSGRTGELPVNFEPAEDGIYSISVDVEGVNVRSLHLIDKLEGVDIDLLRTPTYQFKGSTADRADRFALSYSTGTNTQFKEVFKVKPEGFSFYNNGTLIIDNEGEATLQVIDVNGHVLRSESINGNTNIDLNAAAGVYMLRLVNGNDVKVQKVVVR